jgi:hypothetical protein
LTSTSNAGAGRLLLLFKIFASFTVAAQNYGNGWIDHSLSYLKFPAYREGIYRIDSTLLSQHYNLENLNAAHLTLFFKGKEQRIYVHGESDGKINTGDYIEAYLNPEPGDIDSLLYRNISHLPNRYSGLFSDTVFAYLTVRQGSTNMRYLPESDTTASAWPAAAYFYDEKKRILNDSYNDVIEYAGLVSDPKYTSAEGRGTKILKGGFTTAFFFQGYALASPTLNAVFTVHYSGGSKSTQQVFDHQVRISYTDQANNVITLTDTVFSGFAAIRNSYTLNAASLGATSEFSFASVASPTLSAVSNNTTYIHFFSIFYPRTMNLGSTKDHRLFIDDAVNGQKQSFHFLNLNTGTVSSAMMYDITNGKKLPVQVFGTNAKVVVPNTGNRKFCFLSTEENVVKVSAMSPAGSSGQFTDFTVSQPGVPFVIIYHPNLLASAQAYKDYRQSPQGGSYRVILADIRELYDQFAWGANKHPVAIRNFARFLGDSLSVQSSAFLLLGRSTTNPYNPQNLVPSIGRPSCDNMLLADINASPDNEYAPAFPIGRIAATTNAEAINYLDKVKQHEGTPQAEWKKRVLHFVGGNTEAEVNELSGYMSGYAATMRDTLYGAEVFTYKKTSSNPIQVSISDSIRRTINGGAGVLTFFGHGNTEGFDQAIDNPDVYANAGRYPFLHANSCLSGNIHTDGGGSVSEKFVLIKQKGTIGFLASTALGYIHALNNFSHHFYNGLSRTMYDRPIGEVIKDAAILNAQTGDIFTKFLSLDMTLHGDPAVRVSPGRQPDYQLKNSDLAFDLQGHIDSVGVTVHMKNVGRAPADSFVVRVERHFPNGDTTVTLRKKRGILYKDSLKLVLPIEPARGFGLNGFNVMLDYQNRIAESDETNNATTGLVDVFIPGGDIAPVYPYKFAVVPNTPSITLKASSTDPFAPLTSYRFQLDTNDSFQNPIRQTVITSKGGVIEWNVTLPFKDSTVYFWRVSRDSTNSGMRFYWRESSFQTVGNKRGWAQAQFHQFSKNGYQYVNYSRPLRKFVFHNNVHVIRAHTGFHPYVADQHQTYYFNNVEMDDWSCTFDGWNFVLFDQASGEPHKVVGLNYPLGGSGQYGNCPCKDNTIYRVYGFGGFEENCDTTGWKDNMENFLNAIKPGTKVLAYTTAAVKNKTYVTGYKNSLYDAFESIGAKNIRTITDTVPYILFGRKGMTAGQAKVAIGANKRTVLDLEDSISSNWNSGFIASEVMGPSLKWHSLHWRLSQLESAAGDTTVLKVVGITASGKEDTLATFKQDSTDVYALGAYVNAATHPYLKLVAFMRDNVHRTSPQLRRWHVLFDEAPECAINPLRGFEALNDNLQEGDEVKLVFPIENIGSREFSDSLVVRYWIENARRERQNLNDKLKPKPFVPGQVLFDTVRVDSRSLVGANGLWIHVNPANHSRYQTEKFQFNNIARQSFTVSGDVTNPLLDVTFDGRRILDGDIVSARPVVLVTLKDENKFLALNDTSAFTVFIRKPSASSMTPVYFAGGELEFTPAQLPKNSAKVIYRPVLAEDGRYTLQANARDRSNNKSGSADYKIDFEVNNRPTVTNVMNYPNPFTTSTRFVFTLTGSEIPEVFTIQIMTITGKLVREITRSELGALYIGRNITEFAWDGRDAFGDRLANGVYLYRVRTKLNGDQVEKSASGADRYFTKEFGKMVLMK